MIFTWGDAIIVLNQLINGVRSDAQGRYVCKVLSGPKKGFHQVTLLCANSDQFFYVEELRLIGHQEYFDRLREGKLPENAAGHPEFLESEGTKGHLLGEILKENE